MFLKKNAKKRLYGIGMEVLDGKLDELRINAFSNNDKRSYRMKR